MSFITSFKSIITANASINALATGGIKFGHLPEDSDITKNWVVWDFRINEQVNTLSFNDAYKMYSVSVTATSTDSVVVNTLSDLITDLLNGTSTSELPDINFVSDSKTITLSKPSNAYQNQMEFNCIYTG